MKISEILKNPDGTYSSRRFGGFILVIYGLTGDLYLFIESTKILFSPDSLNNPDISVRLANISKLFEMCNKKIYTGAALFGATGFDNIFKKIDTILFKILKGKNGNNTN